MQTKGAKKARFFKEGRKKGAIVYIKMFYLIDI